MTTRAGGVRLAVDFFLVVAIVLVVWSPFLAAHRVDDRYHDWTLRTDYLGYELNALVHDHELPFWVTSGRFEQLRVKGIHDFFANPETDVLSPVPLLAMASDYLTAVKVFLAACLTLGVYGCFRIVRAVTGAAGALPALVLALLSLCNGAMASHVISGHTQFISTAYFPFVLALEIEAFSPDLGPRDRLRKALAIGPLLAAAYYSGNTHPLFWFLIASLALFPGALAIMAPRSRVPVLITVVIAVAGFVGLTAFKLLPGIEDYAQYHATYLTSFESIGAFAHRLVLPWQPEARIDLEYDTYVGAFGVAALALGVFGLRDKRMLGLLLAVLLLGWTMFLQPGSRLLGLPFLRTQGTLTRFRLVMLMLLGVPTCLGVKALQSWAARRARRIRSAVAVFGAALVAFWAVDLHASDFARHVRLGCHDPLPTQTGPYDVPLPFVHSREVTVHPISTRANCMSYEYRRTLPEVLFSPDKQALPEAHLVADGDAWLMRVGPAIAIAPKSAHGTFTLRYRDPWTTAGLGVTSVTLLGVLLALLLAPRMRVRRAQPRGTSSKFAPHA